MTAAAAGVSERGVMGGVVAWRAGFMCTAAPGRGLTAGEAGVTASTARHALTLAIRVLLELEGAHGLQGRLDVTPLAACRRAGARQVARYALC